MKIENLNELKAVLELISESRVKKLKIGEIEIELGKRELPAVEDLEDREATKEEDLLFAHEDF